MHRAMDVLFFNLAYPRWEFVFQPTAAAYLNLIEPWWKTRKLASQRWHEYSGCTTKNKRWRISILGRKPIR